MKDHQLKALVQVADRGSIRAAARAMNLSQSALTKALRELEEDVGAELLQRSYKGVGFTPEGNALLVRARLVLATIEKARAEIRLMRGGAGAHVKAAITPLLTATVLPDVLGEFRRAQPDAELTFHEGLLVQAIPGLIEGKIDFAIALASARDLPYEIEFEPLAEIEAVPFLRRSHPLAGARDWSGVAEAPWVLNLSAGSQSMNLVDWLAARGFPAPSRILHCSSPFLILELARRNDLIGYGPKALIIDPCVGVGLTPLLLDPLPPPMSLGLLTLRNVPLGSAAKKLAGMFRRHVSALSVGASAAATGVRPTTC
ncbi:LysR substrate-binding domain-containing protein [Thauera sp.]|uniref:LysR substrate-binding domain-containing protein n=1 Tax=Thauera sp. TaxID=1905334 RepID=UPI002B832452|nr:LysR substrate-binding domain-containing protein [Thauera sp.]HRP23600.1 LysR substrate-binding domain-containing protein [Thauera sp.]